MHQKSLSEIIHELDSQINRIAKEVSEKIAITNLWKDGISSSNIDLKYQYLTLKVEKMRYEITGTNERLRKIFLLLERIETSHSKQADFTNYPIISMLRSHIQMTRDVPKPPIPSASVSISKLGPVSILASNSPSRQTSSVSLSVDPVLSARHQGSVGETIMHPFYKENA
jgi:hypothetical protein